MWISLALHEFLMASTMQAQQKCLTKDKKRRSRRQRRLTKWLSSDDTGIFPRHGCSGVPLVQVLYEGVTLVHRATDYLSVLGEDDFYVGLLDNGCVEVADKDSGVEGAWVILVGHVAGLGFTSHSPPVALLGHRQSGGGHGFRGFGWGNSG